MNTWILDLGFHRIYNFCKFFLETFPYFWYLNVRQTIECSFFWWNMTSVLISLSDNIRPCSRDCCNRKKVRLTLHCNIAMDWLRNYCKSVIYHHNPCLLIILSLLPTLLTPLLMMDSKLLLKNVAAGSWLEIRDSASATRNGSRTLHIY